MRFIAPRSSLQKTPATIARGRSPSSGAGSLQARLRRLARRRESTLDGVKLERVDEPSRTFDEVLDLEQALLLDHGDVEREREQIDEHLVGERRVREDPQTVATLL